jgi:hypothetical protein
VSLSSEILSKSVHAVLGAFIRQRLFVHELGLWLYFHKVGVLLGPVFEKYGNVIWNDTSNIFSFYVVLNWVMNSKKQPRRPGERRFAGRVPDLDTLLC